MPKGVRYELVGERFGRLVVACETERRPQGGRQWLCRCDCGKEAKLSTGQLVSGNTKSCGCLRREAYHTATKTHGMTRTRTYRAWADMIQRCRRDKAYRDVEVCSEWKDSFEKFLDDMGECPEGLTLDRINPRGDYEKQNCRWADWETQNNNRRDTMLLTLDGVTKPLRIWADETGIEWNVIRMRVNHLGWSHKRALTTPVGAGNKMIEYQGRIQSLSAWCHELGLKPSRTQARLGKLGWSVEKAFSKEDGRLRNR